MLDALAASQFLLAEASGLQTARHDLRNLVLSLPVGEDTLTVRDMTLSPRERRESELRDMRASDPARIVALYRGITNTQPDGQLPYGISFDAMIAAIVAFEEETAKQSGESSG